MSRRSRARQWLVRAGIDPGRIVAHTNVLLSLAVAVEAGQSAEVQCIIDVAESSDPDGHPSFWELAGQRHVYRRADAAAGTAGSACVRLRSWSAGILRTPIAKWTEPTPGLCF